MLNQSFFEQDTLELAPKILGCQLIHETSDGLTSGIIVETEVYCQDDAASHSYRGMTERNKIMFGPGGFAYVYFTYGRHYCFNVVSGPAGNGQAVLIRALEPSQGLDLMKQRRAKENDLELCSGPAKLVQAMGITKADYGKPLFEGNLYINPRKSTPKITSGPRIGISQALDKPWRFWTRGNRFVSR